MHGRHDGTKPFRAHVEGDGEPSEPPANQPECHAMPHNDTVFEYPSFDAPHDATPPGDHNAAGRPFVVAGDSACPAECHAVPHSCHADGDSPVFHRGEVGAVSLPSRAIAFGYLDETCRSRSLVGTPHYILIYLLLPQCPCIPGSWNARQVIRAEDIETGWDKMGQNGTGYRNFCPMGHITDRTERGFGKKWEIVGWGEKISVPFFPKGTSHSPQQVRISRIIALYPLCSH